MPTYYIDGVGSSYYEAQPGGGVGGNGDGGDGEGCHQTGLDATQIVLLLIVWYVALAMVLAEIMCLDSIHRHRPRS